MKQGIGRGSGTLEEVKRALKVIGTSETEVDHLLRGISAVLHLGQASMDSQDSLGNPWMPRFRSLRRIVLPQGEWYPEGRGSEKTGAHPSEGQEQGSQKRLPACSRSLTPAYL